MKNLKFWPLLISFHTSSTAHFKSSRYFATGHCFRFHKIDKLMGDIGKKKRDLGGPFYSSLFAVFMCGILKIGAGNASLHPCALGMVSVC